MTITSFNPVILTKKPEEAIALFEALGFERSHQKSGETENDDQAMAFATVRMKEATLQNRSKHAAFSRLHRISVNNSG